MSKDNINFSKEEYGLDLDNLDNHDFNKTHVDYSTAFSSVDLMSTTIDFTKNEETEASRNLFLSDRLSSGIGCKINGLTCHKYVCTAVNLLVLINQKKQEIKEIRNHIADVIKKDESSIEDSFDIDDIIQICNEEYEKFFTSDITSLKNLEEASWKLDFSMDYLISGKLGQIVEKVATGYYILDYYDEYVNQLKQFIHFDDNFDNQQCLTGQEVS